jgi:SAM-dependent methyltransferase
VLSSGTLLDPGGRRRDPPWWDHQRHSLVALRKAIDRFLNTLPISNGEIVADIGCGKRPYEPLIRARGFDYIACDLITPADIVIVPGERIAIEDASVAGVVSFQVLEHVWDLDWYLGECRRILKPGGGFSCRLTASGSTTRILQTSGAGRGLA